MPSATQPIPSRGRPPTGHAQSAAERMRRYRARQRAAGLRTVTRFEPQVRALPAGALQHRFLEARCLAMHCLMAQKIERVSALLDRVRQTLETWRARYTNEGDPVPRALAEWQRILGEPWPVIAALMTDAGERGTRLRQSTPFAGVLTPEERERVYAAFRS